MTVRLDGKVAVITGAGTGIGRAIALDFAARGATTVGTGRRLDPLEDTRKEVEALGGTFTAVQADNSQWEDCRRTVDVALAEHGRIDILINNAGNALPLKRIDEIEPENWRNVAGVTLEGSLFMSRLVLPTMQAQRDGVILFISSGSGVQGLARYGAYGVSKAAVIHLSNFIA